MKIVTEQALLNKQGEDIIVELSRKGQIAELSNEASSEDLD